jgi:hypothetical protein
MKRFASRVSLFAVILTGSIAPLVSAADRPWVTVAENQRRFVFSDSQQPFLPRGFNYDHDEQGRLIEDYWLDEWEKVEQDFQEMKDLGANVVRIHLQFGRFMESPTEPRRKSLEQLARLLKLAEGVGLHLDLTGLGCYHKADVPAWYDALAEHDRWQAQARFWEAVAETCAASPAVFCYDLMNEPVVPGGTRKGGDWLGPAFGGKHFVQFITLDQSDRPRPEVAREWVGLLKAAIRKKDARHLITVGLVDWSLDRPGLTSGFVPKVIAPELDFVCVHLYPETGKLDEAMETLKGFSVGKPVVIEETFPLKCSMGEFSRFIEQADDHAAGWIGFYWGRSPEELRQGTTLQDSVVLGWLEFFQQHAKTKPGSN